MNIHRHRCHGLALSACVSDAVYPRDLGRDGARSGDDDVDRAHCCCAISCVSIKLPSWAMCGTFEDECRCLRSLLRLRSRFLLLPDPLLCSAASSFSKSSSPIASSSRDCVRGDGAKLKGSMKSLGSKILIGLASSSTCRDQRHQSSTRARRARLRSSKSDTDTLSPNYCHFTLASHRRIAQAGT